MTGKPSVAIEQNAGTLTTGQASLLDLASPRTPGGHRDNNLNLIRMLAASGVLVSHAWPLALGAGVEQPMERLTGHALGTICVYIFFAISGFLIAASFERTQSRLRFVAARSLRLFPGLLVSLLIVAFAIGPIVTTLSTSQYLSDPGTATFLLRNITLAWPQFTLPGVFENNPYPTVEGSIWTLIHEVICYIGLFGMGVLGLLTRLRATVVLTLYVVGWLLLTSSGLAIHPRILALLDLSLPFGIGMAAWLWRSHIAMSWQMLIGLFFAWMLVSALNGIPEPLVQLVFVLMLSYVVFWFAYVPAGTLRRYNRLGDYSYGIYIYAFPIQGLVVWIWGPMSPLMNIALALPLTLIPSVLSWHYIEKPALSLLRRNRIQSKL